MGTSPFGELETTAFIFDDTYPEMIAEKLRVLQHYPEHGRCWLPDDLDDLTACLWSVAEYMATRSTRLPDLHGGGVHRPLVGDYPAP
jgi:hypothetical protein